MTEPAAKEASAAGANSKAGASGSDLYELLAEFEGQPSGPPTVAPDAVNLPMIRHWVEAMGDENPVYLDAEAARGNGFAGVVAPATMLQAWIMRGYRVSMQAEAARAAGGVARTERAAPQDRLFELLDEAGFTSVVATNCEQSYRRPLELGDQLTVRSVIESVSPQKATALGDGHFVTTRLDFTDQNGDEVATQRFRILRFRPRSGDASKSAGKTDSGGPESQPAPKRPRPAITQDNAFFFEGARAGKLLVQRCSKCAKLRHPPRPSCPNCHSLEWDTVESSGLGNVYSYVVVHHPQVPAFEYPLPIAVVELSEGTRLVADLVHVAPEDVQIGMAVECEFVEVDDELTLPMFHPVSDEAADTTGGEL